MKEDFLHHLWKFKKFDVSNLKTISGEDIIIINSGQYTQLAGPDFFNAQIQIGSQKWAGNVEIHLKSSDWYAHGHEKDAAYDNVILHVVWEHDTDIFDKSNKAIPVIELKSYVSSEILGSYNQLMQPKSWIFCEKQIQEIAQFQLKNWQERLFFERLERKAKTIEEVYSQTENNWETVLFLLLAKNFGLNTNGEIFFKIANSIPFQIIRKEAFEVENIEALFFGMAGLLDSEKEDNYYKDLKIRFLYLLHKYNLERDIIEPVQFFKHRPDNFPTIRLSQLANLYATHQNLFSKLIESNSIQEIQNTLQISVSDYWLTHYNFDKESPKKKKSLSNDFINLLIINTIVPIKFAYSKSINSEIDETILQLIEEIPSEKNAIIDKFSSIGIKSKTAFDTQSLLQLKNEYCNKSQCMSCAIGVELLQNKI